jgi:hypothetical protein
LEKVIVSEPPAKLLDTSSGPRATTCFPYASLCHRMLSRHAHPARQAGTQASADWQKGATCITCEMRGALHASGVCRTRIAPLNFQRHSWRDILLIWWVQRRFINVRRRHEPNVGQPERGALAKFPEVLLFAG